MIREDVRLEFMSRIRFRLYFALTALERIRW